MENKIKEIKVTEIKPHPQNPRLEIGDVEELAASIKAKGILQNLTVVESDAGYTCIIGHRRLTAAKQAGLDTVPCVVAEMSEREQIETMLLENMQRSDLTIYEQAQGFQLMMDFGESIEEIAEKTGFSQSTIRRRVKLAELDKEVLKETVERGASLMDYAELEKIKDITLKNEVLKSIGTNNFKWKLENAVSKEKWEAKKAEFTEKFKELGIAELDETNKKNATYIQGWSRYGKEFNISEVDDIDIQGKHYYSTNDSFIELFKHKEIDKDAKIQAEQKEQAQQIIDEKRKRIEEISDIAYTLRADFMKEFWAAKKHSDAILEFVTYATLSYNRYNNIIGEDIFAFYELNPPVFEECSKKEYLEIMRKRLKEIYNENPLNFMAVMAWVMTDSNYECYIDKYRGGAPKHEENNNLDEIYEFLKKLGYKMSDEEIKLQNGTHELFEE